MIWILVIAGLALVILAGFAFLVTGVHSTDRHKRLRDTSDHAELRAPGSWCLRPPAGTSLSA